MEGSGFDNGEKQTPETDNGVYICWKPKKRETKTTSEMGICRVLSEEDLAEQQWNNRLE